MSILNFTIKLGSKSDELFKFIKDVKEKEKGKISDEALKLIVKI